MVITTLEEMSQKTAAYDVVYVYGAGMIGQMALRYIQGIGRSVESFLVSKVDVVQVNGIKVQALKEIVSDERDYIIVIGANESNRQEMTDTLEHLGISNYLTFTKAVELEMRKKSFDWVAERKEKERINEMPVGKSKLSVGYLTPGYLDTVYAETRLIIDKINETEAVYIPLPKEIDYIAENAGENDAIETNKMVCEAYYQPKIYRPEVDVIHTFNQVCITYKPWCASFETVIPRIFSEEERYQECFEGCIEALQRDNCLGLFALCQNAYDIQRRFLIRRCGERAQSIIDKTIVLHPPQKVVISDEELAKKIEKRNEPVTFIFIGGGFFIKGGREVVNVLTRLKKEYDFRLVVVSSLMHDDYFTHAPREEMIKYRAILQDSEWIEYYSCLPNEQVLDICRRADVGLLPSFGDTYGYSVLEMQAAGLPVITSDIRALTEINHAECGWIVNLPLNEDKCCINKDIGELSDLLERQLTESFVSILEHREQIGSKGRKAYERIIKMHDPVAYAEKLKEVYRRKDY